MKALLTFDEFEKDWLRRHRASIPRQKRVSSIGEIFWIVFWTAVAIGAALFSAVHSIPAAAMTIFRDNPNRDQLAQTSFMIGELVLFGSAAGRHFIDWLKYLLVASLLVLLVANTSSSIQAVTENGGNILNQFVGILWSIIAPVTALAAGEVLHTMVNRIHEKQRVAKDEYNAAMKELNAKINSAYKRYVKEETEREDKEERDRVAREDALKLAELRETSQDFMKVHEKPTKRVKLHEVANEIRENGDMELSTYEMMEKYGISLGSTSKIREILKARNGNGLH